MSQQSSSASSEAYIAYPVETVGGRVDVPGDKSISHRALLLGAIAEGTTTISGFLRSEDCLATLRALSEMGVEVDDSSGSQLTITGVGPCGLSQPSAPLDLGNSGTAMRLLMGLLATQPFSSTLTGDDSLRDRPMERVAKPLREMGADIVTTDGKAPVDLRRVESLKGIDYVLPVASAQLKSAILLAGLRADGETRVTVPGPCRDHTERMFETMGVDLHRDGDNVVSLLGPAVLTGADIEVPRDFSSAAFFIVAGLLGAADRMVIPAVGVNPTRIGLLTILKNMGAKIDLENARSSGAEPIADIVVEKSDLRGIDIDAELVALGIDELPVVFIAAAVADGRTSVSGAEELRHKECDRLAVMAAGLKTLGASVEEKPDGLIIDGGRLGGGRVDSHGDHRIAMAFTSASVAADGEIEIINTAPVATSFPNFPLAAEQAGLRLTVRHNQGS